MQVSIWQNIGFGNGPTHILRDRLGEVGNVEVGRRVISFSLKSSIEGFLVVPTRSVDNDAFTSRFVTHTSEANLVTEEVEALDALLRIANVLELGKAETR